MASLKEHANARKAQTTLSRVDEGTFIQGLQTTRDRLALETKDGPKMEEAELIAVVLYRVGEWGRLTEDEFKQFSLLSRELKTRLVREALALDELEEDGDGEE